MNDQEDIICSHLTIQKLLNVGFDKATDSSQSVVRKWLRDEHGIHISIHAIGDENDFPRYEHSVYKSVDDKIQHEIELLSKDYDYLIEAASIYYETALEHAIIEALDKIKTP